MSNLGMSHEALLRLYILGSLKLLQSGHISLDQLHWLVFNPASERSVREAGFADLADIFAQALELEDVLSLCGRSAYDQLLASIEQQTLNSFSELGGYNEMNQINQKIILTLKKSDEG